MYDVDRVGGEGPERTFRRHLAANEKGWAASA